MKTILLFMAGLLSTTTFAASQSYSCQGSQVYFSITVEDGAGTAEIGAFNCIGHGHRCVPLPERIYGPIKVNESQEGTHLKFEGDGFLVLLKSAPFGGFQAILQAPQRVNNMNLESSYSCDLKTDTERGGQ